MLFNSFEFLFGFLPVVLLVFHGLSRVGRTDWAMSFLVLASLFFYGWWNWIYVFLIVGSFVANFLFAFWLDRWRSAILLAFGVAVNLAVLGWYKYAGFFAVNFNTLFAGNLDFGEIVLPLAISFHTFQQIAYLVDVHSGARPERGLVRYALFVTFFPQLMAGPIVHHTEALPQYDARRDFRIMADNLAVGFSIFAIGLFKKVVFADSLAPYADRVFAAAAQGDPVSFVTAWTGTLAFSLQIYFDFSGYSDMAVGLARLFGIRLPLNFDSPYQSRNIIDFWRRWHMTLSRFLRDYLYFPLGGNRHGPMRRYLNLMIVMVLGGLWHGAAWTFVFWGALHGAFLVVNHAWRGFCRTTGLDRLRLGGMGVITGWALTFLAVTIAWVPFRAPTWDSALLMLRALIGLSGIYVPESYAATFGTLTPLLQALGLRFGIEPDPALFPTFQQFTVVSALLALVWLMPNSLRWMARFGPILNPPPAWQGGVAALAWRPTLPLGFALGALSVIAVGFLLRTPDHAFIYFQF